MTLQEWLKPKKNEDMRDILNWIKQCPINSFLIIKQWKQFWYNLRINKAVKKWNQDLHYIRQCILEESTPEESRGFYWNQLVWQEISMYISIGKSVQPDELAWLCSRRGFTLKEQNYLQSMMQHVGLMK